MSHFPVRVEVEAVGGTVLRTTWPCGHYRNEDLNSTRRPLARRVPTETGVRILARGGFLYAGPCPTCGKPNLD